MKIAKKVMILGGILIGIAFIAICAFLLLLDLLFQPFLFPPRTPEWDAFSHELRENYPNIISCNIDAGKPFTFSASVTTNNISNSDKKNIAKEIIRFVLSDNGFPEMVEYFRYRSKDQLNEFTDFNVYFINNASEPHQIDQFFCRRSYPRDSGDSMRGFTEWSHWDKTNKKTEPFSPKSA